MDINEKMQIAIDVARQALKTGELPISAVIFYGDEIISSSFTSERTDKRFLVHAELKALMEADMKRYSVKKRKEMQLFTTLEPCMMCLGASMSFFIGEIYYALDAPSDGAVGFAEALFSKHCEDFPNYKLPAIHKGILKDEAKTLFVEYVQTYPNGPMVSFVSNIVNA